MPSARGIRAGRAFVELFADDSKLVRGLRGTERRLKAFGKRIGALGRRLVGLGAALGGGKIACSPPAGIYNPRIGRSDAAPR